MPRARAWSRPRSYRDYDDGYDLIHGSGGSASVPPGADLPKIVAMLWLPNPEYRSGWETYQVTSDQPPPTRPPLGYPR